MKHRLVLGTYAVIAGFCALLNVGVIAAGGTAGLHYAVSTTLSFCVCVLVGYALHARFTFRASASFNGLTRYAGAMALNLPLALASMWLFHAALHLPVAMAAVASTCALTAYNYISSRWAIASGPVIGAAQR